MPRDIYIKDSFIVDEDFHSRYSASWKEYRYYLSMQEYDPIQANYVCQLGPSFGCEAHAKDGSLLYWLP